MSSADPHSPAALASTATGGLSETVRADLDAIFAEAEAGAPPPATPAAQLRAQRAIRALRPDQPRPNRTAAYGAIAAAALAGVSIGAVLTHGAPGPAAPPRAALAAQSAPPAAPAAPQTVLAAAQPAPVKIAKHNPVARPARTEQVRVNRRPTQSAVQAADRQLRQAYLRAVRARVPQRVLVDYQERWEDLRESDADRPRALVRDYGALADGLGRAAEQTRPARAEPMDPLPLRWPFWR